MDSDGANIGVTPERALKTIIGGKEQPADDEQMTDDKFKDWLLTAPAHPLTYDDTARCAAKIIYDYLTTHPEHREAPAEVQGEWRDGEHVPVGVDLYDEVKKADPTIKELGLTGFQWGYAVNAAKHVLGLPPVANPAFVTVDI